MGAIHRSTNPAGTWSGVLLHRNGSGRLRHGKLSERPTEKSVHNLSRQTPGAGANGSGSLRKASKFKAQINTAGIGSGNNNRITGNLFVGDDVDFTVGFILGSEKLAAFLIK